MDREWGLRVERLRRLYYCIMRCWGLISPMVGDKEWCQSRNHNTRVEEARRALENLHLDPFTEVTVPIFDIQNIQPRPKRQAPDLKVAEKYMKL